MPPADLLTPRDAGLYCAAGDFYVDPWKPVDRAVVSHAHADHARAGCASYLAAAPGADILRLRLGDDATIQPVAYGRTVDVNGVRVSLHPAGHLLGSAQIRVEHEGRVCVFSGDYKLQPDDTCASFEPVPCDTFISECTFGLPIYRWPDPREILREINRWWSENQSAGRTSVLFAYALGKAQRLLSGLEPALGPILVHGAIDRLLPPYRAAGIDLPATRHADDDAARETRGRAMVLAPPSAARSPWLRKFGDVSTGFASGWMRIRGTRRRRSVDRGFVLSDHVDWPGLHEAIEATGASTIGLTHGYTDQVARWLTEQGRDARVYRTRYEGERDGEGGDSTQLGDSTQHTAHSTQSDEDSER